MDGLVDDGFVFLGGPIGDSDRNLLVVEATDEQEIDPLSGNAVFNGVPVRIETVREGSVANVDFGFDGLAEGVVGVGLDDEPTSGA